MSLPYPVMMYQCCSAALLTSIHGRRALPAKMTLTVPAHGLARHSRPAGTGCIYLCTTHRPLFHSSTSHNPTMDPRSAPQLPLHLTSLAILSPTNAPLYVRSFTGPDDELRHYHLAHAATDVIEERSECAIPMTDSRGQLTKIDEACKIQ